MVQFIKAHALTNYEEGGWDVIVECWSDDEIAEHLIEHGATNEHDAVRAFFYLVDVWSERQADARICGGE